jgi:hypothetical protein
MKILYLSLLLPVLLLITAVDGAPNSKKPDNISDLESDSSSDDDADYKPPNNKTPANLSDRASDSSSDDDAPNSKTQANLSDHASDSSSDDDADFMPSPYLKKSVQNIDSGAKGTPASKARRDLRISE